MEVGLEEDAVVVTEVSSPNDGILPSKYWSITRVARGLLTETQLII
jgi:hypothetical protein